MATSADPILIRNRAYHLRRRDAYYRDAVLILDRLVTDFSRLVVGHETSAELVCMIDDLCEAFKRAGQHGLSAKGGELASFPRVVVDEEELFVDHIKTMRSSAKNVKSFLTHVQLYHQYLKGHQHAVASIREYVLQVEESDENAMLTSLKIMRRRVEIYDRLLAPRVYGTEEHD